MRSNASPSKQISELLRRETSIADDAAHRDCIYWVVPWNRQDPHSVRHDDVLALPGDPEPSLFECLDGPKVRDSRYLRHPLCRDFHFPQVLLTGKFLGDFEVFPNRILDVGQSFLFGGTLRPAPREARAGNAVPLFGWYQSHWVLHTSNCNTPVGARRKDVREAAAIRTGKRVIAPDIGGAGHTGQTALQRNAHWIRQRRRVRYATFGQLKRVRERQTLSLSLRLKTRVPARHETCSASVQCSSSVCPVSVKCSSDC